MGTLRSILEFLNRTLGLLFVILKTKRQKEYDNDVKKINDNPDAAFDDMFGDSRLHKTGDDSGHQDLPSNSTSVDKPAVPSGDGNK